MAPGTPRLILVVALPVHRPVSQSGGFAILTTGRTRDRQRVKTVVCLPSLSNVKKAIQNFTPG